MRKETVEAGAVVGSPGGEVCRGGKGSEGGLVADRFPVGLVRVRMPVKAVLRTQPERSMAAPLGVASLLKAST
jgi:hypothetical protein